MHHAQVRDLLVDPRKSNSADGKSKLDVRQSAAGNVVPGLTEVPVQSTAEVAALMARGAESRAVGSHDMNEHSSRSHSILTITANGTSLADGSTLTSKLNLIDLAGSERVSKTDATGERLKEAQNINRSLSALGDVINALGKKGKGGHVPFRNSKLTFLLQDSLSGNSKVLMFCNISPVSYNVGETMCTLNFAARCRSVELGQARKGGESAELRKYKLMVTKLQDQLASSGQAGSPPPPPPIAVGTPASGGGGVVLAG